jgi:hypothetical protein
VGSAGFPATTDARTERLELVDRSLEIVAALDLAFATITWAVDGAGASPVRLNACPDMVEVMYAWDDLEPALVRALTA